MFRRIVTVVCVCVAWAATASAQGKVEVSGNIGWTFSDGVSGQPFIASDGNAYDRVDPKDSVSYGFTAGFLVTPQAEVGFMYGVQTSKLLLDGTNEREVGDLSISTYHGYFAYNFGEEDHPIRPFVFFGLGATSFGSVDTVVLGNARTINGETQFSATLGGGVKFFFSKNVGARVAGKLTPTYVKSDTAGWWCDPFYGCYLVGDPQYSNQFEISGGVVLRF